MHRDTETRILSSCFNTPGKSDLALFNVVLRAGHLRAGPEYRIERDFYQGHDLLLCVRGRGHVRSGDQSWPVRAGQIAWIDCSVPHAHWPDTGSPWELLWMRIDGTQAKLFADALGVGGAAVFTVPDSEAAGALFADAITLLRKPVAAMNAALNASVAALVALLFEALGGEIAAEGDVQEGAIGLGVALAQMQRHCDRNWRVEELAQFAGLSVPQFFRRFRKATGASPIDWLRRQRVSKAKARLIETEDTIRDIATELGYDDPFYFSREFKKLVGVSPRAYREQERFHGEGS